MPEQEQSIIIVASELFINASGFDNNWLTSNYYVIVWKYLVNPISSDDYLHFLSLCWTSGAQSINFAIDLRVPFFDFFPTESTLPEKEEDECLEGCKAKEIKKNSQKKHSKLIFRIYFSAPLSLFLLTLTRHRKHFSNNTSCVGRPLLLGLIKWKRFDWFVPATKESRILKEVFLRSREM